MSKPAIPVPGGEARTENPDGVTRTFGDESKHSLYDAIHAGDMGRGFGAFPYDEECDPTALPSSPAGRSRYGF